MIPSPVYVNWLDQRRLDSETDRRIYPTCSRDAVPLTSSDYLAFDQGNCSPRYMRASTYILPTTDDLAQSSHIPLGFVVQPFAPATPGEHSVPVADFTQIGGPPRCNDCRAYINPWCVFRDGGNRFECNLCGSLDNIVPQEYFSHLDPQTGRRLDVQERPELSCGSVDFVVPKEYWVQPNVSEASAAAELLSASTSAPPRRNQQATATQEEQESSPNRPPEPINIIFAIDVSWTAGRSGMLHEVLEGIREVLYGAEQQEEEAKSHTGTHPTPPPIQVPLGAKIAIITYDRTVHFYNLKVCFRSLLDAPQ